MTLKDIALNNLRRRKGKAAFLLCGMAIGIATVVTLFAITSALEKEMSKSFEKMGAKILIVPKTDNVSFSVGGITVASKVNFDVREIPVADVDKIKSIQDFDKIKTIAPKLLGTAPVEGSKALLVGVDFPAEMQLKPWWQLSGRAPENNGEIMLGSELARKLSKKVGDSAQVKDKNFTVSGILEETGTEEDGIAFMPLPAAQAILGKPDSFSFIEVNVERNDEVLKTVVGELAQKLPEAKVSAVKEAAEARRELVDRFASFSVAMSVVMLVVSSLIALVTMMSSVNDRTREIGIFRAIGFRQSHVMKIIFLEAAIVSAASGIAGYLAGMAGAIAIAPYVAQLENGVSWNPLLAVVVIALAVVVGLLATVYPAKKAARLDPAEALRYI